MIGVGSTARLEREKFGLHSTVGLSSLRSMYSMHPSQGESIQLRSLSGVFAPWFDATLAAWVALECATAARYRFADSTLQWYLHGPEVRVAWFRGGKL